ISQIVGRFLEHHRVYQFGRKSSCKLYISSADFMTRNIRNRMEVACPIYQDDIKKRILDFLDIIFADDVKRRILNSKSDYEKLERKKGLIAQEKFIEIAKKRASDKKDKNSSKLISNKVDYSKKDNEKINEKSLI